MKPQKQDLIQRYSFCSTPVEKRLELETFSHIDLVTAKQHHVQVY